MHPNSVHRVGLERHWWLRPESLAMYAKLLVRSLALRAKHRFRAVHAGRVLPEGLVGLVVARLARVPLVVYAHGEEVTGWRKPGKFRAKVYVYRRTDSIIANSDFTRAELLKLGVSPDRIELIQPGVDIGRFRPGLAHGDLRAALGLPEGRKLVLSVGRLSRRKGFDHTIRALAGLRAEGQDLAYAVIGVGPDHAYLQAVAQECGVAGHVHLLGHVAPEDLPRWYCAADVFAMPNRSIGGDTEGFGMVFIEAAACGTASVAGRDGGTGDAVVHDATGYRIDGTSVDEIAAALRRLLADAALARSMGDRAHLRARAEFSWESVADKTRRLRLALEVG
jgi:phosphatidylinositol alpha-1,6-mannosyltransferase